jgi:hypothetical protein
MQWFTTRKSYTTIGLIEKDPLLLNNGDHFINANGATGHFCGDRRTSFGTLTAAMTQIPVGSNTIAGHATRPIGTGINTPATADTFRRIVHFLNSG